MTNLLRFWDSTKVGTLIIGSPRFGTHFFEKIVAEQVGENNCISHGEVLFDSDRDSAVDNLSLFVSNSKYSTLIITQPWVKIDLLSRPDFLDQWHTIRITHTDKRRWFISWWFWLHHKKSFYTDKKQQIFHHGTPRDVYEKYINATGKILLKNNDILETLISLSDHLLNHSVPVNEEIDYSYLKYLQTDKIHWIPNQYPDYELKDIFENFEALEKILLTWSSLTPWGKFVERNQ